MTDTPTQEHNGAKFKADQLRDAIAVYDHIIEGLAKSRQKLIDKLRAL